MSVKSIPRKERGSLDPRAMYHAVVEEFKENPDWTHKDGVTGCYVGKIKIEGIVQGTSVDPFDPWMAQSINFGFYLPAPEAKWYDSQAEALTAFCDAVGIDQEDGIDPDEAVGKTLIIQVKVEEGGEDGKPKKYTRDDETWGFSNPRTNITKFYPTSYAD